MQHTRWGRVRTAEALRTQGTQRASAVSFWAQRRIWSRAPTVVAARPRCNAAPWMTPLLVPLRISASSAPLRFTYDVLTDGLAQVGRAGADVEELDHGGRVGVEDEAARGLGDAI